MIRQFTRRSAVVRAFTRVVASQRIEIAGVARAARAASIGTAEHDRAAAATGARAGEVAWPVAALEREVGAGAGLAALDQAAAALAVDASILA